MRAELRWKGGFGQKHDKTCQPTLKQRCHRKVFAGKFNVGRIPTSSESKDRGRDSSAVKRSPLKNPEDCSQAMRFTADNYIVRTINKPVRRIHAACYPG